MVTAFTKINVKTAPVSTFSCKLLTDKSELYGLFCLYAGFRRFSFAFEKKERAKKALSVIIEI